MSIGKIKKCSVVTNDQIWNKKLGTYRDLTS